MNEFVIMEEILEVGKRLYSKGLVASNDGNISVRLDDGRIMITATGVCKGDLTADDILITDEEGNLLMGVKKPTSEIKMHLAVYKKRSDVNAIVHAHPPKTTAFAVAGLNLDKLTLPEVIFSLGSIAFAEYGTPSTQQLPDEVSKVIENSDAVILANHGALTVGTNVMDAYFKMETLEHFAQITIYARQLGGGRELSSEEKKELFRVRSDVFGKKGDLCTDCGICTDGKSVKDRVPDCVMAQEKLEKQKMQEDEFSRIVRLAIERQLKNM